MSKQKQPFNNLDIPGGFISHFLAIIITAIVSFVNQMLGRNENTLTEARLELATRAYASNFDEIINNELTQNQTTEEPPRRARGLTLANLYDSEEGTAAPDNTPASKGLDEVNSTDAETGNSNQTHEDSAALVLTNPNDPSNQAQEHLNSPISGFIPHSLNSSEFLPFDSNETPVVETTGRRRTLTVANLDEVEEEESVHHNTPASATSNTIDSTSSAAEAQSSEDINTSQENREYSTYEVTSSRSAAILGIALLLNNLALLEEDDQNNSSTSAAIDNQIENQVIVAETHEDQAALVLTNPNQTSNQTQEHINSPVPDFLPLNHNLEAAAIDALTTEMKPNDSNSASKKLTPKKLLPITAQSPGEGAFDLDDFASSPKLSGEEAQGSDN